jgi:transcriptional regulator with XRE-family HTH domain
MNYGVIKQRIRERLTQTGQTAKAVSLAIGKHEDFLSALLTNKKESFSADLVPHIARELRCDANYLLGMSDDLGEPQETEGIAVAGSIEPGVWRRADRDPSVGKRVPLRPDPRFPAQDQQLWLVRSDTLDNTDISDGGAVLTVRIRDIQGWFNLLVDDDLVVVERDRDGDVLRTVLRVKRSSAGLELQSEGGDLEPILWKSTDAETHQVRLVGVIIQIVRFRS